MPRKLIPLAIVYDFDGTLASGNIQEHQFIPEVGMTTCGVLSERSVALQEVNEALGK